MRRTLPRVASLLLLFAWVAQGHPQPTTLVLLDVRPARVAMNLHLPAAELALAFGHAAVRNGQLAGPWEPALRQYLLSHIKPVTAAGQPWTVDVLSLAGASEGTGPGGPRDEVLAQLALTPPAGASLRNFNLHYDVILHQVVTHKALVSVRSDWEAGRVEPAPAGVIAVDTGTTRIEPLAVRLEEGSRWAAFRGMVALGMHHIYEGTDHLLFLLVLLLPATLLVYGRKWGPYGGGAYSLWRLLKIITAFTAGHSLTLLLGSLRWVALPAQPVEVLIAASILVTAIHALRPIFAGREAQVAAGFGLVHGLAFATVLADLQLGAGALALSIFGFNLGIELMQLFVIALVVPWLLLLSQTPAHWWVRNAGAVLAAIAALGWMGQRLTGAPNGIERLMSSVAERAPWGVLLLAAVAIPAYAYTVRLQRRTTFF